MLVERSGRVIFHGTASQCEQRRDYIGRAFGPGGEPPAPQYSCQLRVLDARGTDRNVWPRRRRPPIPDTKG